MRNRAAIPPATQLGTTTLLDLALSGLTAIAWIALWTRSAASTYFTSLYTHDSGQHYSEPTQDEALTCRARLSWLAPRFEAEAGRSGQNRCSLLMPFSCISAIQTQISTTARLVLYTVDVLQAVGVKEQPGLYRYDMLTACSHRSPL